MISRLTQCSSVFLAGITLASCASLGLASAEKPKAAEPTNVAAVPANVDGAVRSAQLQRISGDLDGAIRTMSQLVLVSPDDPRVLGEYGKILIAKGQSHDALAFLRRAIELQPTDWMLYSAEGVAYDQQGNYRNAQEAFSQALALKPGDPTVLNNAAMSRLQAGDAAGAEDLLTQAAHTDASNTKIASNLKMAHSLKGTKPVVSAPEVVAPVATVQAPSPAPVAAVVQESPVAAATVAAPTVVSRPVPVEVVSTPPSVPTPAAQAPKAEQPPKPLIQPNVETSATAYSKPVIVRQQPANPATVFVQAGAFGSPDSAGKVAKELSTLGARVSPAVANGHAIFRVRIGPFHNSQEADAVMADIRATGHADVKIVRE